MGKLNQKGNTGIIFLILVILIIGTVIYSRSNTTPRPTQNIYTPTPVLIEERKLNDHTSNDLKISFQYPKEWFVDDRDYMLLLTNYPTSLNRDDKPKANQIEVMISYFSKCFPTIEEDLINPGCGEGGEKSKNKIVSKEMSQTNGGTFYKYVVETPRKDRFTYYLLQKDNYTLQIDKNPDPSQFEKEFEEIINSIKFL